MTRRRLLWLLLPLSIITLCWIVLASHWGLAFALHMASSAAPDKLEIESSQGSLLGPIKLDNLHYHDTQFTVSIKQLRLDWHILALLSGRLKLQRLDLEQVNIDVHSPPPSQPKKVSAPNINVILPIAIDLKQANVHQLVIKTSDVSDAIVIDKINLSAYANLHDIHIHSATIQAYKTHAQLKGQIKLSKYLPLKMSVSYDYRPDATHQLKGKGTLKGDLQQLNVNQSLAGMVQLSMRAKINDVLTKMNWQTHLDIAQLNLQDISAHAPPTSLHGKVTATGDLIALNLDSQLQVSDQRYGLLHVNLKGDTDLSATQYHFDATGDYRGGDVGGINVPMADFSVNGAGTQQQVDIDHLSVRTAKGNMQGQAHINWQQELAITSKLTLHQLQTEVISPQWPGKLSGELSLQTEQVNGEQLYHFVAHNISGKLRGYPLQGDVHGSWQENQLAIKQLQLTVGGTKIKAQGKLAQQWNVAFEAHSNNLNSLLPAAKGKLDITGQLFGSSKQPKIKLKASAKQLSYATESIGALQLDLNMGLAAKTPIQFNAKAEQVLSRAGLWTTINLKGNGTTASHILALDAISKDSSLHTRVRGKFEPWHWQGQLTALDVQDKQFGKWHLKNAVAVSLEQNQYTLANLCLVSHSSHLCAKGYWETQNRQLTLDGNALPLALIQPWLPPNVKLSGEINAQGTISLLTQNKVQASLKLISPDKSIKVNFTGIKEQLVFGECTITAVQDDKGLHAVIHLPMTTGGGMLGNIKIPGWVPQKGFDKYQPVDATLTLENIPADFFSRFIPNVRKVQGQLQANFQIGGSFGKPHVHGNVQWQGGSVLIAQLGISIHDIRAEIKTSKTNTLAFTLQARSNNGDMRLEGETHLNPSNGWPTNATLISHNLEVANIPEAIIIINSNLHIKIKGNNINLDGDITVPRAQLKPKTIPEGTAQLSPDVVIVDAKRQVTQPSPWIISSRINVQLGDQVEFNGFGIKGNLNGKLQITDEPGKLTLGQGEIKITQGTYLLRQKNTLKIRRGRLIFSNSFINNPVVDVEAIRTIDVTVAGVRIKGTLKNPQLSLFSEPSMPDADILSYLFQGRALTQNSLSQNQSNNNAALALGLVTGDFLQKDIGDRLSLDELRIDVNQTTQNAQLVLGRNLSLLGRPLYLRYTTDFGKSSQLLQFQWQISKHLQIQTESGIQDAQSVKGGDIFFTWNY